MPGSHVKGVLMTQKPLLRSKMAAKVAAMTNDVIGLQVRLSLLSSAFNRISLIIIFSLDASSKLLGAKA